MLLKRDHAGVVVDHFIFQRLSKSKEMEKVATAHTWYGIQDGGHGHETIGTIKETSLV